MPNYICYRKDGIHSVDDIKTALPERFKYSDDNYTVIAFGHEKFRGRDYTYIRAEKKQ